MLSRILNFTRSGRYIHPSLSTALQLTDAVFQGIPGEICNGIDVQFSHDAFTVGEYGLGTDAQSVGDHPGVVPFGDELQDFPFTFCDRGKYAGRILSFLPFMVIHHIAGNRRAQVGFT